MLGSILGTCTYSDLEFCSVRHVYWGSLSGCLTWKLWYVFASAEGPQPGGKTGGV